MLAVAIALFCALFCGRAALAEPMLDGAWAFTVTNPQGPTMHLTANLQEKDGAVTGTLQLPDREVAIRGTIKGASVILSWTYDDFEPGLSVEVTLSGQVENGVIKGSADYGTFGSGEWNAARPPS